MTAGGVVGTTVPLFNKMMLDTLDWRSVWMVIGVISFVVAVVAAVFVRDRPEDVGLLPDGDAAPDKSPPAEGATQRGRELPGTGSEAAISNVQSPHEWAPLDAMRTRQFFLLVICGVAYAVPWGVVMAHGRLHLEDVGFSTAAVTGIFSGDDRTEHCRAADRRGGRLFCTADGARYGADRGGDRNGRFFNRDDDGDGVCKPGTAGAGVRGRLHQHCGRFFVVFRSPCVCRDGPDCGS